MTVPVDWFERHESFYYPPLLTTCRDMSKFGSASSYNRKNQTNSYNFLQITWANACDTNLDDCTGRLVWNARIILLSTLTLHPPKWMANSTLYFVRP